MTLPQLQGDVRDSSGQVAISFALLALPILLMIGLALDASRQLSSNQRLEIATDIASIAAARAMEDASLSDSDLETIAQNSYMAQLESAFGDLDCDPPEVEVQRADRTVKVNGSCELPTVFGLNFLSTDTLAIAQATTAEVELSELELALTLDISESTIGAPEIAIRAAATQFVDTLLTQRTKDRVRISLVPFATSVNAGVFGNRAMGRLDHDDRFGDGADIVCVREREGVEEFTDDRPAPGQWVREMTSTLWRCPESSIIPLSDDPDQLKTKINSLIARSSGSGGHVGIAWAWYTLSPKWRSVWPAGSDPSDYGAPNTVKAAVLLTDGGFTEHYDIGYGWDRVRARLAALELCQGMRDAGIKLYVIGVGVSPDLSWLSGWNVVTDCAGDDAYFIAVDDEDHLDSAFDQIASQLKWARIKE